MTIAYQVVQLIQRHEGDPMVWGDVIFSEDETFGTDQINAITWAVENSSVYDRQQTARRLYASKENHKIQIAAYVASSGRSASSSKLAHAEQSQQFLGALIELLES
jgi:hypothetical protein